MPSIHSSPILLPMPFNPTIIYQLCAPVSHNFVNCCGAGASGAQKTGRVLEICARRGRSHWTDEVAPAGVRTKSLRLWRMRRSFLRLSRWRGCAFSCRRAGTFVRAGGAVYSPTAAPGLFVRAGAAAAVRPPLNAETGYHMMVNCAPAKCLCLPDLVPAQAIVRAGNGGGNSECGGWARLALRFWRGGLPRFTPGLAVLAPTFCLSLRPALRFYRRVLPQFMPGLATLARLLPSVRAFGLAVLAERLSSVCAR